MDVSENSGTPKSSTLNRVFHYKPSILGYPYFWKHPYRRGDITPNLHPSTHQQDIPIISTWPRLEAGEPHLHSFFRQWLPGSLCNFAGTRRFMIPSPKTHMVHLKMGAPWKFGDSELRNHPFSEFQPLVFGEVSKSIWFTRGFGVFGASKMPLDLSS